jgi:hypothetical protein
MEAILAINEELAPFNVFGDQVCMYVCKAWSHWHFHTHSLLDTQVQGDQIGRIFAQWVIVCFGQLHENYRTCPHFWATLFKCKVYSLILVKTGLG